MIRFSLLPARLLQREAEKPAPSSTSVEDLEVGPPATVSVTGQAGACRTKAKGRRSVDEP